MRPLFKPAILFVAIGLAIYAALYYAAEQLMYRNGHSNAFFKIATAAEPDFDWVILGASHAMPLDFADFNSGMRRDTSLRIINLASPGTGPLYNRFVLEEFLRRHRARSLLYVVDSFAFRARTWNEDRFGDAKLLRATPFTPALARRFIAYARRDSVDPRAALDYVTGFSKINNRDRFRPDMFEGEPQFERVHRPSASALRSRIAYLYPQPPAPGALSRYLSVFEDLLALAERRGLRVAVIKMPLPAAFRAQLPDEKGFDEAIAPVLARHSIVLRDFSASLDDPKFYLDTDHLNRTGLSEFYASSLRTILLQPTTPP